MKLILFKLSSFVNTTLPLHRINTQGFLFMGAFRGRVSAHYNPIPIGKRLSSGAFFCPLRGQKNRAFRSKSSDLQMQILWAFRYNPLRSGSSEPGQGIACGNSVA
jgi:hypothetical protein